MAEDKNRRGFAGPATVMSSPPESFPMLSDLRNSRAIEQVADGESYCVYRAEKYNIFYDPKTKEDFAGEWACWLLLKITGQQVYLKFHTIQQ